VAEVFSSLEPSILQLSFEVLALAGRGLFFAELIRNRANKAAEDMMAPREGNLPAHRLRPVCRNRRSMKRFSVLALPNRDCKGAAPESGKQTCVAARSRSRFSILFV